MLGGALWSDAPAYILKIIMKCKEIKVEYAWNVVIGGGATVQHCNISEAVWDSIIKLFKYLDSRQNTTTLVSQYLEEVSKFSYLNTKQPNNEIVKRRLKRNQREIQSNGCG